MADGSETECSAVDRAAKAMERKRAELIHQPLARIWRELAQAAIASLREPTDAMLISGLMAGSEQNRPFADRISGEPKAFAASLVTAGDGRLYRTAYCAMIDEALKESA